MENQLPEVSYVNEELTAKARQDKILCEYKE